MIVLHIIRSQNYCAIRVEHRKILFVELLINECHLQTRRGLWSLTKSQPEIHLFNHLSLVFSLISLHLNFVIFYHYELHVCLHKHARTIFRVTSTTSGWIIIRYIDGKKELSRNLLSSMHFLKNFLRIPRLKVLSCSSMNHFVFFKQGFVALYEMHVACQSLIHIT